MWNSVLLTVSQRAPMEIHGPFDTFDRLEACSLLHATISFTRSYPMWALRGPLGLLPRTFVMEH